jgi:hypothetical protein
MKAWRGIAAATLALSPVVAPACAVDLGPGAHRLADARYTLLFRPTPEPITLGRHFALDFVVCPAAGTPLPTQVHVDATMPEHKHGMNYRASISSQGHGRYRAEGLMLHMPGRWELLFELRGDAGTARLTQTLQLQ